MKTLRLTAICIAALMLVAAGCSGGSSDKPLGPFLVDSISPADGSTDMAVISVIQIEFTNAVKNASIQF
ncbi:MAG: Ig-like domain-containing protein, partial [Planctomycetota bacterium]|nr:Ig-like domain-containing protein [Planctomycetota bacterium]